MGCCCFAGLEVSPEPCSCKGSLYHSAVLLALNPQPLFHPSSPLCSFLSYLLCVGGNRRVGKKNWGRKRNAFKLEDTTFIVSCIWLIFISVPEYFQKNYHFSENCVDRKQHSLRCCISGHLTLLWHCYIWNKVGQLQFLLCIPPHNKIIGHLASFIHGNHLT